MLHQRRLRYRDFLRLLLPVGIRPGVVWSGHSRICTKGNQKDINSTHKMKILSSLIVMMAFVASISAQSVVEILAYGLQFRIVLMSNTDLCVSDGGGNLPGETTFKTVSCASTPSSDTTFTYDPSSKQLQSVAKPGLCMHDGGRFVTGISSFSLQPCIIAGGIAKHQQFTIDEVNDFMFYGGIGIHSVHKAALCLGSDGTDVNFQLCKDWSMDKWFNLEFVEETINPVAPVIVPVVSTQVSLQDILQNQLPFRLRSATQYNLCVTDGRGTGSRFGMYACDTFPVVDVNPADKAFEYLAASKRLRSQNETGVCLRHDDIYGNPPVIVDVYPCFSPLYHQMFNFETLDVDTMAVKLRSDYNPELCLSFDTPTDTTNKVFVHFCDVANPNQVFILDDIDLPATPSGQGSVLADQPNQDCYRNCIET